MRTTKENYKYKMAERTKLYTKKERLRRARLYKGQNRATLVIPEGGTGHPGAWLVKRKKTETGD